MGRKKKPFIDKKSAQTFRLVHRSQKDPLQADEESAQHVFIPVDAQKHSEEVIYSGRTCGLSDTAVVDLGGRGFCNKC
eukprot:m.49295 g.49295  ORF g.49295 m.49295 type:complete len:78 (+) comp33972_c0_seq13:37-270(+)